MRGVIRETVLKKIQNVATLHAKLGNNDDGERIIAIIFYLNISVRLIFPSCPYITPSSFSS